MTEFPTLTPAIVAQQVQRHMLELGLRVHLVVSGKVDIDRRVPVETALHRATQAMVDLSLVLKRLGQAHAEAVSAVEGRKGRTKKGPGVSEGRIIEKSPKTWPVAVRTPRRKRGGQPGNRNNFRHGYYGAAAKAERGRLRMLVAEAGRLKALGRKFLAPDPAANEKGADRAAPLPCSVAGA